jgi:hypothetical protein
LFGRDTRVNIGLIDMNTSAKSGLKNLFVVVQLASTLDKGEAVCEIFPAGDEVPAIYVVKFGPASKVDCENWIQTNCKASPIRRDQLGRENV